MVVLTGPDTPLWLLDDESFEKVATTPAPFVQVFVLDTGFFAVSVDDIALNIPFEQIEKAKLAG